MRHLFASRAAVYRLSGYLTNGTPTMTWSKISTIPDTILNTAGELMCRVDLGFVRMGRDLPMAVVAGRAPDRVGVAFFTATDQVKAGDRLVMLSGPVSGTFEIRSIPDPAVDMTAVHHMEVQVVEVAQDLSGRFPSGTPEVTA